MAFLVNWCVFFKGKEEQCLSGLRCLQNTSESLLLLSALFVFGQTYKVKAWSLVRDAYNITNTGLTLYQRKSSLLSEI